MPRATDVQHFIYPLTEDGGYSFDDSDITPENYWVSALAGDTDEWGLSTGFRLIEPGDWVWAYFGGGVRRICGVGTVTSPVGWRSDWGRYAVRIRWDAQLTAAMKQRPIRYEEYRQQVQASAVRASASTQQVLDAWLQQERRPATPPSAVRFATRTVAQRLGQTQFRLDVLRAFGGACAVTGCAEPGVLQAAHILPVEAGGRHDVANALLLRADLHNLFDLGRLTINARLEVEVDPAVADADYRRLVGTTVARPSGVTRAAFAAALADHRRAWGR